MLTERLGTGRKEKRLPSWYRCREAEGPLLGERKKAHQDASPHVTGGNAENPAMPRSQVRTHCDLEKGKGMLSRPGQGQEISWAQTKTNLLPLREGKVTEGPEMQ